MQGSKLFQKNRALGYVSNHVPASIRFIKNRKEHLIATCVGRSFNIYASTTLRLLTVSGTHPEEISCIASDPYFVYAASGNDIYEWKSGNILNNVYKGHKKQVHLLLPFGNHLISIDVDSNMKLWDTQSVEEYLDLPFNNDECKISAIMHPYTYINKVLIGSDQGGLQIWNIRDCKLVYTLQKFDSKINVLEQAPAVDVVAIGLQNGKIIILNLKYDEKILEFTQDWGSVTGVSFRTDGNPIMATSSTNGKIVFWDLEEKRIASQLKAHDETITTLACLKSEPLMITTSPDNSIKMWIFDLPDGGARLLNSRGGHSAPPTYIRYYGSSGHHILSAGEDSTMRVFNTITEILNKSMGKASYNRKASKKLKSTEENPFIMPPIVQFATEITREQEWDNILAAHTGLGVVTTWSFHKNRMGEHKLMHPKAKDNNTSFEVSAITLSYCGNFAFIGYVSGNLEKFNIQSGIHRMTFGNPAHKSAVRGIHTDILNQLVISGGSDGLIKFWNFKTIEQNSINIINVRDGVLKFQPYRESGILAVALENFTVVIIDCEAKTVIRKFSGHSAQITDMCFSADGRWLITAGMDCVIKIYDIPTSYLIDHFKVDSPCISLTISPKGDYLATAHVNCLGIFLWANKTLFSYVSLRAIDPECEPPLIDLVNYLQGYDEKTIQASLDELTIDNEGEEITCEYSTPTQLDEGLITMSPLAASRWQNLLNLDIIKKRNKPKELVVPKHAPFFLPTVSGLDLHFDLSNQENKSNSKLVIAKHLENLTTFGKLLKETLNTADYQPCIEYLLTLGPALIDYEIKSLKLEIGGTVEVIRQFIKMLIFMFKSNVNFEFAQSYTGILLKYLSEEIMEHKDLRMYIDDLEKAQSTGWKVIEEKLLYSLGVVTSLRNFVN